MSLQLYIRIHSYLEVTLICDNLRDTYGWSKHGLIRVDLDTHQHNTCACSTIVDEITKGNGYTKHTTRGRCSHRLTEAWMRSSREGGRKLSLIVLGVMSVAVMSASEHCLVLYFSRSL